jgi:hypothetical protein
MYVRTFDPARERASLAVKRSHADRRVRAYVDRVASRLEIRAGHGTRWAVMPFGGTGTQVSQRASAEVELVLLAAGDRVRVRDQFRVRKADADSPEREDG